VTAVHAAIGIALVAVNIAAGVLGLVQWRRRSHSRAFWPLLRAGQVLVALAAIDGVVLLAMGRDLPELHLVYGLTPLGVSFLAEQLRLASADSVLQARDLESAQDMRGLDDAAQHEIVTAIVLREMAVMAASALVVAVLGLRAGGWL
jgi:hypothetical protein